jgi:hypothetical protein
MSQFTFSHKFNIIVSISTLLFWIAQNNYHLAQSILSPTSISNLLSWTGWLCLTVFSLFWLLPLFRNTSLLQKYTTNAAMQSIHEKLGMVFILVFSIHAMLLNSIAMILIACATIFFLVLGTMGPHYITNHNKMYFKGWWILHITYAFLLAGFVCLHVWNAVAYNN